MSLNNIPYFTLGSNQGLIKGRWQWCLTKRTTTHLLPTIPLLQSQCFNLAWLICASKTPAILNRFPNNSLALWATAERAGGRGIARGLRGNRISWKASAGVFKYTEEIDQRGREGNGGDDQGDFEVTTRTSPEPCFFTFVKMYKYHYSLNHRILCSNADSTYALNQVH